MFYFRCPSNRQKIFNDENFPIYGTSKTVISYYLSQTSYSPVIWKQKQNKTKKKNLAFKNKPMHSDEQLVALLEHFIAWLTAKSPIVHFFLH